MEKSEWLFCFLLFYALKKSTRVVSLKTSSYFSLSLSEFYSSVKVIWFYLLLLIVEFGATYIWVCLFSILRREVLHSEAPIGNLLFAPVALEVFKCLSSLFHCCWFFVLLFVALCYFGSLFLPFATFYVTFLTFFFFVGSLYFTNWTFLISVAHDR